MSQKPLRLARALGLLTLLSSWTCTYIQAQGPFSVSTYEDSQLTDNDTVQALAQINTTYDGDPSQFTFVGICMTLTSPDGLRSVQGEAACSQISWPQTSISDQVQLSFDATSTGNYSFSVTYQDGYSAPPPVWNTVQHIIGVAVSATNYIFSNQTGNTCTYTPQDCDVTPTCGAAQGRTYATDSAPCYSYYLQQMGSIIFDNGTRRCYPLAYIPPNYFSGGQNARAACT
jgi:hypothetical protein